MSCPHDLRDQEAAVEEGPGEMKQLLEAREQELRPGQEIEDKKQISFADPVARIMKQKGDFEYAYNAQISVDGKSQVTVGQHVSSSSERCSEEVAPALDDVEETSGRLPEKLSLDTGTIGEELAGDVGSEGGSLRMRRRTRERSGGRGTWTRA